jgi:hypothetical protein
MLIHVGKYKNQSHRSLPSTHLYLLLCYAPKLSNFHKEELVNTLLDKLPHSVKSKLPAYPNLADRMQAVKELYSKPHSPPWCNEADRWHLLRWQADTIGEYTEAVDFLVEWLRSAPKPTDQSTDPLVAEEQAP